MQFSGHKINSKTAFLITSSALVVLQIVSLGDFVTFSKNIPKPISLTGARNSALIEISKHTKGEMVLPDTCVNGLEYKAVTNNPIAGFNYGMAWPANPQPILSINSALNQGILDTESMKSSGISLILSQDSCDSRWKDSAEHQLIVVSKVSYTGGVFTLYRLTESYALEN